MAHELLIEDGRAAMFYVDDRPWHGLGNELKSPPTSEAAIDASGLNWRVAKVPLYVAGGTRLHELKDKFAVVREDHLADGVCHAFGVAGRDYVPLQNVEAFQFFDPIVREGHATYETAGALGKGERVWVLARLREDLQIADGDHAKRYLLLSNTHNGTSSLQLKITPVRVVCNNTLTLALAQGGTIRVRHDRDMKKALDRAKQLLGLVQDSYAKLEGIFRSMVATRVDPPAVQRYLAAVFPDPVDAADAKAIEVLEIQRALAIHLFHNGQGNSQPAVKGTLWAAYNGVTELIDHRKATLKGPDCTERRLHSVWFGRGAAIKARAFRVAAEWIVSDTSP